MSKVKKLERSFLRDEPLEFEDELQRKYVGLDWLTADECAAIFRHLNVLTIGMSKSCRRFGSLEGMSLRNSFSDLLVDKL